MKILFLNTEGYFRAVRGRGSFGGSPWGGHSSGVGSVKSGSEEFIEAALVLAMVCNHHPWSLPREMG